MPRKILVADDETKIVKLVSAYLEAAGFQVIGAKDGREALARFASEKPDCVVLDINMPERDGLDVVREIRKRSEVPILLLTARAGETDRIVGLELGADDYVVKPFSPRELTARVKAVLRRIRSAGPAAEEVGIEALRVGEVVLDPEKHEVFVNGEKKNLTSFQFALLRALMSSPGRVFSRAALLEAAGGSAYEGYERTIDTHIKNIRKALGDDGDAPTYIGTVRGVGYKFIDPGHEA